MSQIMLNLKQFLKKIGNVSKISNVLRHSIVGKSTKFSLNIYISPIIKAKGLNTNLLRVRALHEG